MFFCCCCVWDSSRCLLLLRGKCWRFVWGCYIQLIRMLTDCQMQYRVCQIIFRYKKNMVIMYTKIFGCDTFFCILPLYSIDIVSYLTESRQFSFDKSYPLKVKPTHFHLFFFQFKQSTMRRRKQVDHFSQNKCCSFFLTFPIRWYRIVLFKIHSYSVNMYV